MHEASADIVIIGGGTGGIAAALGALSMGHRVIMTEETDWLGGQLTAQAVPPDEHPWIEMCGCTDRYRAYRNGVRQYYRDHYPLTAEARANPRLNPGNGLVSRLCHEFTVGVAVIDQMLGWHRSRGDLKVLMRHRPIAAASEGDRVTSVTVRNLENGADLTLSGAYILDATELGDLLALAGVEYVSGAESQDDTGEPHAVVGPAQPENVQSFTWCMALGYDPDGEHVIEKPAQYDYWRSYEPELTPPWTNKLLSWQQIHPITLESIEKVLMPDEADSSRWPLWLYRRIACRDHYAPGARPHEATLMNWPMNDYWCGNIIDAPEAEVQRHLEASRELTLSMLYWMQTEAPRAKGGTGYPGLYPLPEMTGTADGLAKYPYIRESRRIRALFTVTENHVGEEARDNRPAERFPDSVGVGYYRIDLHPSSNGTNYIDIASKPFQIPLGSLIPQRVENLLPACKNLGVTHITNGCYRLHPVEWNIGESAGILAAFCLKHNTSPRAVLADATLLRDYQAVLQAQGVELEWPDPV